MNGELRLSVDNLKPGTYKVVIAGADNKNFAAKEITSKIIIKKLLSNKKKLLETFKNI